METEIGTNAYPLPEQRNCRLYSAIVCETHHVVLRLVFQHIGNVVFMFFFCVCGTRRDTCCRESETIDSALTLWTGTPTGSRQDLTPRNGWKIVIINRLDVRR